MHFLNLTLPTPEEDLALDEVLLLAAEEGTGGEVLRFWESSSPFVVVGIGAKVDQEVYLEACCRRAVPVLRRCSGGGTVVQGPGCLNYALVLKISDHGSLTTIPRANQFVMQRNAGVIARLLGREVHIQGHTDLVLGRRKFSGNAQRRLRHHLLFHGTFLLEFDTSLISEFLQMPKLQPNYRQNRSHSEFVENVSLDRESLIQGMKIEWKANETLTELPGEQIKSLVEQRYSQAAWNFRR